MTTQIQYNTVKFTVKNANGTAVTLQSAMGKEAENTGVWSLNLTVHTHCEDDDRLFQVLAAAMNTTRLQRILPPKMYFFLFIQKCKYGKNFATNPEFCQFFAIRK